MAAIRLDKSLGTIGYDNLFYDLYPAAEVFSVELAAGTGTLERGSLLDLSSKDSNYVIHGTTAATGDTLTANCILAEDVELDSANEVIGQAYRTGHFAQNMLKVKSGGTITEADKENLRDVGILLSESV